MTTTINMARESVYQHFAAGWSIATAAQQLAHGIPIAAIPYALGDEKFEPHASLWVRVTVRHQESRQETLGGPGRRKFERPATVFVQGFIPPGGDTRPLEVAMEAARQLFEGCRVQPYDLRFNAATIRELGVIEGGRWEAMTNEVPFGYTSQH